MSVVLETPPTRKRTGMFVGVGLLVVAALAVGGWFLLKGGDEAPTFSLTEAAANAADAEQTAFTMSMSTMGTDIKMDGELDTTAGLMHMTMDVGGELFGIDEPIEVIADLDASVIYMGAGFFEALGASVDTDWIKIDKAAVEASGQDASVFDQLGINNPLAAATIFDTAEKVNDLGLEEIEGEQVRHYEVTVKVSELLQLDDTLQQQADQLGTDLPDTVTYDVYITEDDQIRRMRYELDLEVSKVKVEVTYHALTEPLTIERPADDNVTDVLDLI
jgi:hypothetical protein